jgi:hypothetical protein
MTAGSSRLARRPGIATAAKAGSMSGKHRMEAAPVWKNCARRRKPVRTAPAGRIPPDILVQYVASTFILVLNWWVESGSSLPAREVNELFRALILPTLAAVSD